MVQDVNGFIHAEQYRTDGLASAHGSEQLVGRVGGIQIGEYKRIRGLLTQFVEWIQFSALLAIESKKRLHFTVYNDMRLVFMQTFYHTAYFLGRFTAVRAEIRVRNHSNFRLNLE